MKLNVQAVMVADLPNHIVAQNKLHAVSIEKGNQRSNFLTVN